MVEIIQLVASCFTGVGIIVALCEFHFMKKATISEHERIQKQATIDYYNSVCDKIYEANHKIYEKFKRDKFYYSQVENDEDITSTIKSYLNILETFATGINTNIYNIYLFDRLYGDTCIRVYNQLEDYIQHRRAKVNEPIMYLELEKMVGHLKEIQNTRVGNLDNRARLFASIKAKRKKHQISKKALQK